MPIPERFLDELMARTDIVDLVSESVRLTKKGSSYWGCCPFHSEKTPSFHVVPDRQIYKCFGCGKGGGAINFVMELENLSFRDAVSVLAKRAGMTMPESFGGSPDAQKRREKMLELNRRAALAFHHWLYAPEGAHGLDYLRRRGLSGSKDDIRDHYGRVACTAAQLEQVAPGDLLRVRKNAFGCEGLTPDRAAFRQKYPALLAEPLSLEDLMVLIEKGEAL